MTTTTTTRKAIISVAGETWMSGRKRSTRQPKTYYVKGFNYGDGMTILRVFTTANRDDAMRFDAPRAQEIVATLSDPRHFGLCPSIEQA